MREIEIGEGLNNSKPQLTLIQTARHTGHWLDKGLDKDQCVEEGLAEYCPSCDGEGNKQFTFFCHIQEYSCINCSGLGIIHYY